MNSGITGRAGQVFAPLETNTGTARKQICSFESDSISLSTLSLSLPMVMTFEVPAAPPSRQRTQRPVEGRGKTRSSAASLIRSLRQMGQWSFRVSMPLRA